MNENKGCNVPSIIFAIAIIAIILLCALLPAIIAFTKAGLEDGFSLESFDLGPSDWWNVGLVALFLGLAVIAMIGRRVMREGHGGNGNGR